MKTKEKIVTESEIVKNRAPFDETHLKLFYGIDPKKIIEWFKNPATGNIHFKLKV